MDDNLYKMNENKKGTPYSFPDSFILIVGYMRIYFHLPYRHTGEGIIKATGKNYFRFIQVIHRFAYRKRSKQIGYTKQEVRC